MPNFDFIYERAGPTRVVVTAEVSCGHKLIVADIIEPDSDNPVIGTRGAIGLNAMEKLCGEVRERKHLS